MVLRAVFIAVVGAVFLAASPSMADGYRPDEFLNLDLSKAVFSPKPLGPPARFEPMPVEAKTDAQSNAVPVDGAPMDGAPMDGARKHVDAAPVPVDAARKRVKAMPVHANSAPKHVNATPKHVNAVAKVARNKVAHARAEKPRTPAGTKLARKHTNPLDAQASDTRIQVWPCRSGGICNWQRSAP
jgi:hypothetical protein